MRDYEKNLFTSRYEVLAVGNGRQALEAARLSRPDLVLADIMMPEIDGIEFLKRLRAESSLRTLPVILLSARAGEKAKTSGIETGADDYLTKFFPAKEFLTRVQTQLYMSDIRQKAIEQADRSRQLTDQQRGLETVLDLVPAPLLLLEPETRRVKFANSAVRQIAAGKFPIGIPAEEYQGSYRVTDESGKRWSTDEIPAVRAARGETVRDPEVVGHTPAGGFSLLVDSAEVEAFAGQPFRIILCLRDITRIKETQRELKRLICARDEFLSITSHDLKTPLTSIQLQTQVIKRNMDKGDLSALAPEKMFLMVEQTDRATARLTQLVDDRLDVSRIDGVKLSLEIEKCDLGALVTEMVKRLFHPFAKSGARIEVDCQSGVVGDWDRFKLEQPAQAADQKLERVLGVLRLKVA